MDLVSVMLVALVTLHALNILGVTFMFGQQKPITYKVGAIRWIVNVAWSVAVIWAVLQVWP